MRRLVLAVVAATLACGDEPGDGAPADTDPATSSTAGPTSSASESGASDETESDEEGSTSTAGETGVGACGAEARCLAAPAEGWLGPIARFRAARGEMPPPCGGGYPDDGFALHEGFATPGPAECDCTCSVHISSVCQVSMYPDTSSPSCSDFSVFIMNGSECTEYEIVDGSLYGSLFQSGTPTCVPTDPVELPEVQWDADVYACGGVELGDACDGGVCTPRAPDGYADQLCIYAQGDNACPDGPFSEKTLLFSSVQDDRGCTECECGAAPPISCTGVFDMYDGTDCTGSIVATGPANGCSGPVLGAGSIHVNLDADTTCPVTTPAQPQGSAEASGLFTYCCEP